MGKNSKQFFDNFITELVKYDQSVLPFITSWFGNGQNSPNVTSNGVSLNNSLNSNETTGSSQQQTDNFIDEKTIWCKLAGRELSSNVLEFLNQALKTNLGTNECSNED